MAGGIFEHFQQKTCMYVFLYIKDFGTPLLRLYWEKFETDLKIYVEITRYLLQIYI